MRGRKKCVRCEASIERHHEVCPSCRERQPGSSIAILSAVAVAVLLAWIAFH